MINKEKQTPFYAMGRFVALFNAFSGEDVSTQLRRVSKIQDESPQFALLPLFKKCLDLQLQKKCPEILEVVDMIQPDDVPERFSLEQLGQFQLGYFHQQKVIYDDKPDKEEKLETAEAE